MEPTLKSGQVVWVNNWAYVFNSIKVGEVVVFKKDGQELIKRVTRISGNSIFLSGDNKSDSLDSKLFGEISKNDIKAKAII